MKIIQIESWLYLLMKIIQIEKAAGQKPYGFLGRLGPWDIGLGHDPGALFFKISQVA